MTARDEADDDNELSDVAFADSEVAQTTADDAVDEHHEASQRQLFNYIKMN